MSTRPSGITLGLALARETSWEPPMPDGPGEIV
jgi:hypothetical protein